MKNKDSRNIILASALASTLGSLFAQIPKIGAKEAPKARSYPQPPASSRFTIMQWNAKVEQDTAEALGRKKARRKDYDYAIEALGATKQRARQHAIAMNP